MSITVSPPEGQVRMSVPHRVSMDQVLAFATSKLAWIREAQQRIQVRVKAGTCQPHLQYEDSETHLLWGAKYRLRVFEWPRPARVLVVGSEIHLFVQKGSTRAAREKVLTRFYGDQVREAVGELLHKWEPLLKVTTRVVRVQKMKSRWGSCIPSRRIIKFNTELAKRPLRFLDYVVLHELVHYFESGHGPRFKALMARYLPNWRVVRRELKSGSID